MEDSNRNPRLSREPNSEVQKKKKTRKWMDRRNFYLPFRSQRRRRRRRRRNLWGESVRVLLWVEQSNHQSEDRRRRRTKTSQQKIIIKIKKPKKEKTASEWLLEGNHGTLKSQTLKHREPTRRELYGTPLLSNDHIAPWVFDYSRRSLSGPRSYWAFSAA